MLRTRNNLLQTMVVLALDVKEHMVVFQKIPGRDHRTYLSNKTNKEEERVKISIKSGIISVWQSS
jgi:hypothetical protein